MEFEESSITLTKEEINKCKHKYENFWYGLLVVINIILIVGVIALCIKNLHKYQDIINSTNDSMREFINTKDKSKLPPLSINALPIELQWFLLGLFSLIMFPFIINIFYAKYRSRAIQVTPKNFPEIYYRVEVYSHKLGLKKVPEAYIVQENGIMNAFSAFILRKQYIQINADLVEIAYREFQDIDSLSFVIAHELAHIKLKHATLFYNLSIIYSSVIPILGSTASRAREYSCDRLAQKLTGNSGVEAMLSLTAGKHLYKKIDLEDYIESTTKVRGFFVWCNNLLCDHPILPKRIRALINEQSNGELF